MRVSRFKLEGDFAGKDGAKVEIVEVDPGKFEVRVRPKHSREDVKADLGDIAKYMLAGGRMLVDLRPTVKTVTSPPPVSYEEPEAPANAGKPVPHKRAKKKSATEIAKSIVAEKPWYDVENEAPPKKKK